MEFCYKGLKDSLELVTVSEAEIDRRLDQLRASSPLVQVVEDRPAQEGDELLLDYAGFCGGEQFEGGTAEMQTLTLGSGMFIPGFEDQLIGSRPGERVTVRVTFPTDYPHEALAGKEAEFRCTVREIREKHEYAMDDAFAKAVGGCDTLEAFRAKVAENLRAYYADRAEMELRDRLLRAAARTLDFTAEDAEIDRAVDEQMETLAAQLAQRGLDVETYCGFTGSTVEQLRADARPEAIEMLRVRAAVEKIAELEQLRAEEADITAACESICARNHVSMEHLKACYDAEFEAAVIRSVIMGKVMRLIRDSAEIKTVTKD